MHYQVKGGPIMSTWCGTEAILVGESIYSSFWESHSNVFSPNYGAEISTRKNIRNDKAAIKISILNRVFFSDTIENNF